MKSRTSRYVLIVLIIIALGGIRFFYVLQGQQTARVFPATINRDCAPWDGTAFTISFRYDPITTITVSIWKSPSFPFSVTLSFPDETMRIGTAYSLTEFDPLEELRGKVTIWRVEEGIPIEGEFSLTSERGAQFKGKFKATWGNEIVCCG
jgi:hypothetical protein